MDNRKSKIVAMRRVSDNSVKLILESEWESANGITVKERDAVLVEFSQGVDLSVIAKDDSGVIVKPEYTSETIEG